MQRHNCRPACRRPFPACSTALCVWLLAFQAATAHSARIPSRALCSRVPSGALPSSLHARCSVWGRRMITHICVQAVAPGATRRCSYPLQKNAMRTRGESRLPGPHLFLRPFTFISRVTRHNKHTHDDTYREDIQRFQWQSPWLQWWSQWPTMTTADATS